MTEVDDRAAGRTPDGITLTEVHVVARAVAAATSLHEGLTSVQRAVLNAMCDFLLGVPVDLATAERVDPLLLRVSGLLFEIHADL